MTNALVSDRFIDFLLYDVLDAEALTKLAGFGEHSKDTFDLVVANARKLAREVLYPAYRVMDQEPPRFVDGRVLVHPKMHELLPRLVELDLARAQRPENVGGMDLPHTVATLAMSYIAAANLSAGGYTMLTAGAAHLIEAFGSEELQRTYMRRMSSGEWMGTMALTEPHAGSSLADVKTSASIDANGAYRIRGSKIFISGGDQDLTENIVHLVLARIDGAPLGTKGISLFVVPKKRIDESGKLVSNDVHVTGVLHKIGWRGLPSVALSFGDENDCFGYIVGEPNRGLGYMFQMMNEARILVGLQAAATASVAYLESLEYARTRPQGRTATGRDPKAAQVPIIEHADVRRMLLRQKAIVEGSLALLGRTARYVDIAKHGETLEARSHATELCDLLTPVAKTFPAERGFESNALAVQIHGGYGYTSEYPVEAWLRDQKLNTIHEGTSGIHSLDLLGRKVMAGGGSALRALATEINDTVSLARNAGVETTWCDALLSAFGRVGEVTMGLGAKGMSGDVTGMLLHSSDYLEALSIVVIAWQWLDLARVALTRREGREGAEKAFFEGEIHTAQYWIHTELPRARALLDLCASGESSYVEIGDASF